MDLFDIIDEDRKLTGDICRSEGDHRFFNTYYVWPNETCERMVRKCEICKEIRGGWLKELGPGRRDDERPRNGQR